jgi:hypothetical protein
VNGNWISNCTAQKIQKSRLDHEPSPRLGAVVQTSPLGSPLHAKGVAARQGCPAQELLFHFEAGFFGFFFLFVFVRKQSVHLTKSLLTVSLFIRGSCEAPGYATFEPQTNIR